jgi:hypothetical protein
MSWMKLVGGILGYWYVWLQESYLTHENEGENYVYFFI